MKKKVFLGGTCEGWDWRSDFIELIDGKFEYFNPVVSKWNEEAQKREEEYKDNSDFNIYVITPYIKGVFSIYEVCEGAFTDPQKTIFAIIRRQYVDPGFTEGIFISLHKVLNRLQEKGIACFRGASKLCFPKIIQHINDYKTPFQEMSSQFKLSGNWNLFKCFTPPAGGRYLVMRTSWDEPEFAHWSPEDGFWFHDSNGEIDDKEPLIDEVGYTPEDLYWTEPENLFKGGESK